MKVEVDQSGKIGDTKVPTALAFSNGKRFSILIPATVKRECIQSLRGRVKLETRFYIQLFSVCLYLLLKKHVSTLTQVTIDREYPGHEAKIKEHLINLLRRAEVRVEPSKVNFEQIGKKSNAHKTALETYSGRSKPDKIIKAEDILREFRK